MKVFAVFVQVLAAGLVPAQADTMERKQRNATVTHLKALCNFPGGYDQMTRFGRMMGHLVVCVATVVCLLTFGASRTSADSFTYGINVGNSALSGFIPGFANFQIDLVNPSMAEIFCGSIFIGGIPYLMGGVDAVDFNVNSISWFIGTISTIPYFGAGFTPGPVTDGGSGHVDGFGVFNQTLDSFDGFSHSARFVIFTLTNTSGTWASAADVLTPNADGFAAAAHIFVPNPPTNASNGAFATGFAAADPPSVTTPEPSSFALLLTGLIGFASARRRKLLA